METDVKTITATVEKEGAFARDLLRQMSSVIVGQRHLLERLMIGLLTGGHILLEGVPGLAKTLTVTTLSQAVRCRFSRIQFTPDLLPADLIGTLIFNPKSGEFTTKKGPVFANIVLADEINRAPAKVQSALLEAMQEKQVTIGEETYTLDRPFLVFATQNPIEQEGTYPLPEAQVDRFMLKVIVDYPDKTEERAILERMAFTRPELAVDEVTTPEEIMRMRGIVDSIYIDEKIGDYIVDIVMATRKPKDYGMDIAHLIEYGASPRASIFLTLAAKAKAFLEGRGYVIPQDVKEIGMDVLRHRVLVSYEAEAEELTSDDIVTTLLENIEVP